MLRLRLQAFLSDADDLQVMHLAYLLLFADLERIEEDLDG
jgi:hypothetical protein